MANISKIKLEYYQISSGEDLVAKLGSVGIRNYGRDRFEKETPRNHYPHNVVSTLGEKSFWEVIYVNPMEFLKEYYENTSLQLL